jgi:hypothetical protein
VPKRGALEEQRLSLLRTDEEFAAYSATHGSTPGNSRESTAARSSTSGSFNRFDPHPTASGICSCGTARD